METKRHKQMSDKARDEKTFRKHASEGYYVIRHAEGWDMIHVDKGPFDSRDKADKAAKKDNQRLKYVPHGSR